MRLDRLVSIAKGRLLTDSGFSLIEALLATSIFVLLSTTLVGSFIFGQQSSQMAGNRARAVYLADEGLQATRNIRDADFADLTDGTHGIATSSGEWILSGSQDVVGIYTREISISSIDADRKEVSCQVTWQQNKQREGSVEIVTYLTNWQDVAGVVDQCDVYCQGQGYSDGICRQNPAQCTNNGETYESGGDASCVVSPSADTCCCVGVPAGDTTAPAAISNLALSGATTNSIDLAWTAPGDDGGTGTATSYDVRYSSLLITEANWASATQATGEPTPAVAGSAESMTVSGLSSGTTYYFAIKTSDEVPNISAISNVPNLDTLGVVGSCSSYCQTLGRASGTCRANIQQCNKNSEIYESGGDVYCTGGGGADTCCCTPF